MNNGEYWRKRSEIREARAYSNCLEATNGLVNAYRDTAANIRREINDFYNRFATENGMDYADAVKFLNREEALEWRTSVEGYIEEIRREKDPAVRERLMQEYDARAYGSRITRLESLNGSIDTELSKLYARANEQFRQLLGENYTDGYYQAIYDIQSRYGYSSAFATVNSKVVENALTYPWSGANFSDRLWKHKFELLNQLRETLTTGLIRGESVQDMSKRLAERMNVSRSNALRLIRTESSHIHNTAELDAYKACGFEEYEYMASFGERTCDVCGGLDGRRFKLGDKQFGVNFPPLHPNCRCTTVAVDTDDDLEDLKSGELDYEQWYQKYVGGRAPEKLEYREGAETAVPRGQPVPVMPGGARNSAGQLLTTRSESSIIKSNESETAVNDVHYIGKINTDIYKCVTEDIQTDEVVITSAQIEHIKERHPLDYEKYHGFINQIVSEPDYILEANKPNTAFVLKRIVENGRNYQLILRLKTSTDIASYKNSVITFLKIDDKKVAKYLRNKKILYSRFDTLDKNE